MPQLASGSEEFHSDGTVTVKRQSLFSGRWHEATMRATEEQFQRWRNGELIQDAFPLLNADQREFLLTGSTPDEWNETFPEDE